MDTIFVPYNRDSPAVVNINGHRVLILTSVPEDSADILELSGADEVRQIELKDDSEESEFLAGLAADIDGGVVLAPPDISAASMIRSLEEELPWIH